MITVILIASIMGSLDGLGYVIKMNQSVLYPVYIVMGLRVFYFAYEFFVYKRLNLNNKNCLRVVGFFIHAGFMAACSWGIYKLHGFSHL